MTKYIPKHDAPNFRKHISKVLFNGHRALLMSRKDWDEVIREEEGEFLLDPAITPMANVLNNCEVVGCIVKSFVANEYSLEIYRIDFNDEKPINKDEYRVYTAFFQRDDFHQLIPSSTDYNDNMKSFFNENVIIEFKPKSDGHHLYPDDLPDLLRWRVK